MVIYETEYGKFGTPIDILRYMEEKGLGVVHVTAKICGEVVGSKDFELNIQEVRGWIEMRGVGAL